MSESALQTFNIAKLDQATMLLALTGWMDGGAVSTGTLKSIMENRELEEIARIDPDPFYIYNFPGSMEIASLFRPEVRVKGGVIRELDMPANLFLCDPKAHLVFFIGKEPNLRWEQFADCIFEVARLAGITRIIFMGSFGGTVPHTREPRMYGTVSHKSLRPMLKTYGVRPSDYKGPAGLSTFLLTRAPEHHIEMIALVAEIPGYLEGTNPLCIEAVSRRLAKILGISIDMDAMREASNQWELQVSEAVQQDESLAATVKKLEEAYDTELIEEEEGKRE